MLTHQLTHELSPYLGSEVLMSCWADRPTRQGGGLSQLEISLPPDRVHHKNQPLHGKIGSQVPWSCRVSHSIFRVVSGDEKANPAWKWMNVPWNGTTPPKFSIVPEKWCLEDDPFLFGMVYFQGRTVKLREGIPRGNFIFQVLLFSGNM